MNEIRKAKINKILNCFVYGIFLTIITIDALVVLYSGGTGGPGMILRLIKEGPVTSVISVWMIWSVAIFIAKKLSQRIAG